MHVQRVAGVCANLALLSYRDFGAHAARMYHDLLVGIGETFPAAAATAAAAARAQAEDDTTTGNCTEDSQVGEDNASAVGGDWQGETGRRNRSPSPPVFHVTEYDVIRGQYPESWEKFAGASGRPAAKRGRMQHVGNTLRGVGEWLELFSFVSAGREGSYFLSVAVL